MIEDEGTNRCSCFPQKKSRKVERTDADLQLCELPSLWKDLFRVLSLLKQFRHTLWFPNTLISIFKINEYLTSVGHKKMSITNHKTKIDIQLHDMLYQQRKFEIALKIFFEFRVRYFLPYFFFYFMWNIVHDLREINNNKCYIYFWWYMKRKRNYFYYYRSFQPLMPMIYYMQYVIIYWGFAF